MKPSATGAAADKVIDRAIRGNLLDRAINYVNPITGAKRQKARIFQAVSGSYISGSKSRRQTSQWNTPNGSADDDILYDLPTTRDRSRDMLRNDPMALGAVNTVVTNVIGSGLKLKPSIDAEALGLTDAEADAWEAKTKREFNLWAGSKNADAARTLNFNGIQELAFRSTLESGDVIALMPMIKRTMTPYKLAVQLIEGDRLTNPNNIADTPTLTAGIKKDTTGAPIEYNIMNRHPGAQRFADMPPIKWAKVPAWGAKSGRQNVIHLFTQTRPGQTRGMPYLAPVIETLKMAGKYTEAELISAVISGMFSVFIETENAQGLDMETNLGAETKASAGDADIKMASGMIVDLKPGEKVTSANPGRPNTAFDPFVQAILRQVGVALELPYEVLVKHFTASYSAARAALLEAWKFFKKRREWLAENFCNPVYENWMDEAVILGRIEAPGYFADALIRAAWLGARWDGPGRGMIKEKEEADAALKKVVGGLSTLEGEIVKIDGGDFNTITRQRAKEKKLRETLGLEAPIEQPQEPAPAAPPAPPVEDEDEIREDLKNETD